jgi:hypothetical protein
VGLLVGLLLTGCGSTVAPPGSAGSDRTATDPAQATTATEDKHEEGAGSEDQAARAVEKMGGRISRADGAEGPVIGVDFYSPHGSGTTLTDTGLKELKNFKIFSRSALP